MKLRLKEGRLEDALLEYRRWRKVGANRKEFIAAEQSLLQVIRELGALSAAVASSRDGYEAEPDTHDYEVADWAMGLEVVEDEKGAQ